jgi:large conductance mechanosensitive channel
MIIDHCHLAFQPSRESNLRIKNALGDTVNHPKEASMLKEFREFAMRGNVLDLAVGIIIGVAFNAVVASLVNNVLMPPIGLLVGRVNFENIVIPLGGDAFISIGLFLNEIINFIVIAFAVFLIVRQANRLKSRYQALTGEPITKECPFCISTVSIRAQRCPSCTSELAPI